MEIFLALLFAAALAFVPATIAENRGHSFGGYWVFGLFLFVPALVVSLLLPERAASRHDDVQRRPCPDCAELIAVAARKCRFCGLEMPPPPPARRPERTPYANLNSPLDGHRICRNIDCDGAGQRTDRQTCEECGSETFAIEPGHVAH